MAQNDTKFLLSGLTYTRRATAKEARQARFLREFLGCGMKAEAARRAGVPLRTVHRWFCSDPLFYMDAERVFSAVHKTVLLAAIAKTIERLKGIGG